MRIHCLYSCLSEIIRQRSDADYRPFYFGVWDAAFTVTEDGALSYYAGDKSYHNILPWFQELFGAAVTEWFDDRQSIEVNREKLLQLVEEQQEGEYIIVQVDLDLLPDREIKVQARPFPHYLMVSGSEDAQTWLVSDPDFRWEGKLPKDVVLNAFEKNPVGGGFYVDAKRIQQPASASIARLFETTFIPHKNELTLALRGIIERAASSSDKDDELAKLIPALKQLKVLSVRKYGYEYAIQYFQEESPYSRDHFLRWAYVIEDLVEGFSTFQYMAIKLAMSGNTSLVQILLDNLDELDEMEQQIKDEVGKLYAEWLSRNGVVI